MAVARRRAASALGFLLATSHVELASGQFPGGGPGGGAWNPPPPICKPFKCKSGEVPVGKPDHQIWSYGCKEAGMNVFNMGDFDPNNPMAGLNKQKNDMDKCCIEKDICKQTCGKTSKDCHELFQKCSKKTCKGNQNCQLQAFMADLMSEPLDEPDPSAKKFDPDAQKCRAYSKGQEEACMCVPKADFERATEDKLKSFYKQFNPEKLNDQGEIKDVEDVWKKWKGKEPDMFMALATKYKAKAVERREKPKPPPYTPPKKDEDADADAEESKSEPAEADDAAGSEPSGDAGESADEEASYDKEVAELTAKKKEAIANEDYDAAGDLKKRLQDLTQAELQRLKERKAKAVESEDYIEAKKIKRRIDRLSEL